MYECMFVCVCVHESMCVRTYVSTDPYKYIRMHAYVHTYMQINIHTFIHIYRHIDR